ncbi:hypothetical protein GCM10010954_29570 [Halobacillus andaensis]|uniref:Uncharacterized protein n=1 Tax=Halobacillus andaensis TaxID=1176239 RepID=A0A917EZD1_HALAA|nr:hypothetical protein GCM10010954_29570 [Halobacillus andaensis]
MLGFQLCQEDDKKVTKILKGGFDVEEIFFKVISRNIIFLFSFFSDRAKHFIGCTGKIRAGTKQEGRSAA